MGNTSVHAIYHSGITNELKVVLPTCLQGKTNIFFNPMRFSKLSPERGPVGQQDTLPQSLTFNLQPSTFNPATVVNLPANQLHLLLKVGEPQRLVVVVHRLDVVA